ncbi:hypothetical protein OS31_23260 [Dickeya oryzae]
MLQHRIILVTGAGDGIGREAALTYARHGASMVLLGRTESKLRDVEQQILQECGTHSYLIPCDMLTASQHDFMQIAGQIGQALPRLDGVLHNAGLLGDIVPMEEQSATVWHQVMQVNVNATFYADAGVIAVAAEIHQPVAHFHQFQCGSSGAS